MPIVLAVATAMFFAASLRLPSLLATLLGAYLGLVANLAVVTWACSLFQALTGTGLAIAEALLLFAALAAWWLRGRPRPEIAGAQAAVRAIASDPFTAALLAVAGLALAYELVLALTVPPTNWDSLTYHLPRVAAWKQHNGIHWIANAPTARMNEFQPLAEQQILFLFVATGSTVVYALPQYAAQLAILAAVYGVSRRLGFTARAAACSAALLATFSIVALQASTAQNDLVAASFPIVAACLLLGDREVEFVLAGVAVGLGLGAKLTTALVWPVLAWLAWIVGRRAALRAIGGVAIGLAVGGIWGYVLNVVHTGHVLGHGQGRNEVSVSPSFLGTIRTAAHLVYRLFDLSRLSDWLVVALAVAGGFAILVALARRSQAFAAAALVLLSPLVALGVIRLLHGTAGDPTYVSRDANEDYAAFGPLGVLALIGAPVAAVRRRRPDLRQLALALALPSFIVLLAVDAKYDIWITRFLLVPVVLVAPLFAHLFRWRAAGAALVVVSAIAVGLTLAHDKTKPLGGPNGRPWNLTQASALDEGPAHQTEMAVAAALTAYERVVPARACVGAVLDPDEPSYLLWGPKLRHRVFFLPSLAALQSADADGLHYVVISTGVNAPVSKQFTEAGWRLKPLASYWILGIAPRGHRGSCTA